MCVFVWQTRKPRQWTKWVQTVLMAVMPACSTGCLCRTSRSKLRCCAACSTWGSSEHSCRPASGSRDTPVVATPLATTTGLENQLFTSKTSDMNQLAKHGKRKYASYVIVCIDLPIWTVGKQRATSHRCNVFSDLRNSIGCQDPFPMVFYCLLLQSSSN